MIKKTGFVITLVLFFALILAAPSNARATGKGSKIGPHISIFKPDYILVVQKFNRVRRKLENRVRVGNPMLTLILQNISKISNLEKEGKFNEAQDALRVLLSGLSCRAVPAGSSLKEAITMMLKGDICPEHIRQAPYVAMLLERIAECESLIRGEDFAGADQNLRRLEKMVEVGPVSYSDKEKSSLYDIFKVFYKEVAGMYLTYDLKAVLGPIENLYAELENGILSYNEIFSILRKARLNMKKAGKLSEPKIGKLRNLMGKGRLLACPDKAVFGFWSLDGRSLLAEHSAIARFEELTGQKVATDNIVLELQSVDGSLKDIDEPMMLPIPGKSNGLKIGPTVEILLLRTWANASLPALEFHLQEHNSRAWHIDAFGRSIPSDKWVSLQQIIVGELDGYLKRLAERLKEYNLPLMFRIINEFNAYAVIWPDFAKDGRTSIFDLCNGKGGHEKFLEAAGTNNKEAILGMKIDCPQAYDNYGSPALPDGPERIRDAWRHIHDIFDEAGATNITWTAQAAPEHGTPSPLFEKIKAWDKMENYWPGRNYLDWGGISGYNQVLEQDKNKPGTIFWTAGWWKEEVEKEPMGWGALPNVLYEFSQIPGLQKKDFTAWVRALMVDYLPKNFRNMKVVQWVDKNMPLESEEEISAFKKYVAGNPYWQGSFRYNADSTPPARITDLEAESTAGQMILSWSAPGDDGNRGKAQYYVIKYRTDPLDLSAGIEKDFRSQPWRLWSRYETKDIELEAPPPQPAGTKQSMAIYGLVKGKYYFGIQSVDDAYYNSRISNIAEVEVK